MASGQGKLATLDHLFSRFHPRRSRRGKEAQTVLACALCNAERARRENLVFRDFVWTLEVLGRGAITNRQKVLAFVDALSLEVAPLSADLPSSADGQLLAMNYLQALKAGKVRHPAHGPRKPVATHGIAGSFHG